MTTPRVLLYDIETSPLLTWNWGIWQQNAIRVKQEFTILSVAWRWLGQKAIHVVAQCDFEDYVPGEVDDYNVVATLHELFEKADIVVAHNGNKFDQAKSRARMVVHGLEPPTGFKEVDTLQVARKQFKFTSNRLDDLCRVLGIGEKHETGGFSTWEGCMEGDEKAWRKMKTYNRHDVILLEALYLRLLPWMTNHPNMAVMSDKPDGCPKCGANQPGDIQSRGWRYYQVTKRRAFRCYRCGGIFYGRHLVKSDAQNVP